VYEGAYCARNGPNNVTSLAGTGPAVNGSNANNHEHWLSVYCGHEFQRPSAPRPAAAPAPEPVTDPEWATPEWSPTRTSDVPSDRSTEPGGLRHPAGG
jgi:hypothetical protein